MGAGFLLSPADRVDVRVYLWFCEWHLFGAFGPGQHTGSPHHPERDLAPTAAVDTCAIRPSIFTSLLATTAPRLSSPFERLVGRHIHFHCDHSEEILVQMPASGEFPFSHKWPTSDWSGNSGVLRAPGIEQQPFLPAGDSTPCVT